MSSTFINPSVAAAPLAGPAPHRWIISRRDDLGWFIGSAAAGYLALALIAVGVPIPLLYFIWLIGVDGPHVIATVTRTYFDTEERARLGWLLWMILPLMAIGPVMVSFHQTALFYLFAVCWQHYHIAKQHFGFMMLWRAKNRERDAVGQKLDRQFLLASTILPLGLFVVRTQFPGWTALNQFTGLVVGGYVIFAAVYVAYQVRQYRAGAVQSAPKFMLLAVLVPLQWLAFGYASRFGPDGVMRAGIALGLFHSFQYHRLLWFHNKNRYRLPGARERHGAAAYWAKDVYYYLFAAMGLYALTNVLPLALFSTVEYVKTGLWGFAFTHYVLDSKIWHVRGNKDLAAALKM